MATTKSADTILTISRTFPAARERVFQAWTDPEALKHWWGAGPGFTAMVAEVDLRVGGRYRLSMKPPEGDAVYVSTGVFREVRPPSRLVYTWAWEGTGGPETLVTVEFHERGTATEVVLTHEQFVDAKMRDEHAQGWNGCFDQLDRHLAR